jgi:hypothetical protein
MPVVLVVGGLVVLVAVVTGHGTIALATAVLAPVVPLLLLRPQRGVLAMTALAPFDGLLGLLPHSGSLHVWKEVLVIGTLLATFVAPAGARRASRASLPGWYPAVAALLLLGAISAVLVGHSQGTTGYRIDFFYILLAWAIWRCPPSATDRDRLVTILMFDGAVTGLFGLFDEVLGGARLHSIGFAYNSTIRFAGGHLRAFSTFTYQSPFAYFLMVVLLLGVSQALTEPGRLRNRLFLGSLPVMLGGLLFTFERGAWIGLAVGCLYLGIRRHRGLLMGVPLAALVPLYLPAGIASTALSGRSLGERSSGWSANLHQVVLHPFGAGIGATGAAAEKVAALQTHNPTPLATSVIYQPDNYYYKTIYELGVIGLWLLVLFLVAAFVWCDRLAVRLQGRDAALADSVAAFIVAAMVASTVSTFFEIYPMDMLTWLLLATIATCDRQ